MKRLYAALLVCTLLILALAGDLLLDERALRVSAQAEREYAREAKRDLLILMLAYPDDISGLERGEDGLIYVQMASGDQIVYDDMKQKSFEEQLACADLQDAMALPYPLEAIDTLREGNDDPGRVRCYVFLHALFGDTQYAIEQNLVQANLYCGSYPVAAQARSAFEAAFAALAAYTRETPSAYSYVFPVNGTYNYRLIAGTSQLSPHAFGIAVDLKSHPCDYWRWATSEQGQQRLDDYPAEAVQIMEDHGFVWGGKWAHFDFLHFEYRPELILKAQCADDKKEPWYAGFPEDEQTSEAVQMIERIFINEAS